MSHQDRMSEFSTNLESIRQVANEFLPPGRFAGFKTRGGATWRPRMLALAALLWATGAGETLVARFQLARKIVARLFAWRPAPGNTYQGFLKLLRKWHDRLLLAIVPQVRLRMEQVLAGRWRVAGFVVFAGDGSRIELPRTASHEAAYSPARKRRGHTAGKRRGGKTRRARRRAQRARKRAEPTRQAKSSRQSAASIAKKVNSPQLWLTLLWHVGTGLPWAWRRGASDCSERGHLQEMLGEMPENSLLAADAGFVGYDFWKALIDAGHHFVIRVGSNVRLLKKLGYARQHDHTVYLWPDSAAKQKQPPLLLRLVLLHNGKHPVYLVTNLPKSRLSDSQAATIYARRWGIELCFRTFKQTFGCRKLRSCAAENAPLELDWSLLALWCVCLLAQRELLATGQDAERLSAARAISAWRDCLTGYRVRPETSDESMASRWRAALRDDYERTSSKTSRNYPRQKTHSRTGPPHLSHATQQQITAAQELKRLAA